MREYAAELNAPSQDEDSQRRKRKKEKKEEVYEPFMNSFSSSVIIWLIAVIVISRYSFSLFPQDDINTIDMEEDKRDLISREISKFRDTHKVKWLLWYFNWHYRFWTAAAHIVHS